MTDTIVHETRNYLVMQGEGAFRVYRKTPTGGTLIRQSANRRYDARHNAVTECNKLQEQHDAPPRTLRGAR